MDDKITLNHPAIQGDLARARRVVEHRTQQRAIRHGLPILAATILVLAIGYLSGHAVAAQEASHADITVLPCSAYSSTGQVNAPAFTFTGACVQADGTLVEVVR